MDCRIDIEKFLRRFVLFLIGLIFFVLVVVLLYNIDNKDEVSYLPHEVDSFEVVVARYNEDLSWIAQEFPTEKVTIYNKGKEDIIALPKNCQVIKLPNLGREAHTYLYHILNNYDQLSERVLFLQGNPFSAGRRYTFIPLNQYKKIAKTRCDNIIAGLCSPSTSELEKKELLNFEGTKWANTVFREYNFSTFKKEFIDTDNRSLLHPTYLFSYGANFAVDRDKILSRTKMYYQKIFNQLDNIAPIEGHYLEKSWDHIFQPKNNSKD